MKYVCTVDGKDFSVEIEEQEGDAHFLVTIDGQERHASLEATARGWLYSLILDGQSYELSAGDNEIDVRGDLHQVEVARDLGFGKTGGAGGAASGPARLKAPIPGLVIRVDVEPGQAVTEGETVVILEAMKMQMELKSPRTGKVLEVSAQAGQEVALGQVLLTVGEP
jgi:biotin carboxyl carrier protein